MNTEKILWFIASALLIFVGISAAAGGLGVILDPSGESLGVNTYLLINSPFENYLIPGILLFTFNGMGSLVASYFNFQKKHLVGPVTIILGFVMIIWIVAQVYWIGWVNGLQPLFAPYWLFRNYIGVFTGYPKPTYC